MRLLGISPIISNFLTFFGAGTRACVSSTCISFVSFHTGPGHSSNFFNSNESALLSEKPRTCSEKLDRFLLD